MIRELQAYKIDNGVSVKVGSIVAVFLCLIMVFTALAFGTVEPWSVAVFGVSVVALLLLWAVKSVVERRLSFRLPAVSYPLIALFAYGVLQSITYLDETGKRLSISMDVEATRLALEVLGLLILSLLLATNIFVGREKLLLLKNFLIFFGLALAVFGLVQHFSWNGKYFWMIEPSVPPSSPFGSFVNHNHFAGYLEMIVPIPAALVLTRAVRGEKSLLYGFAAVMMSVATIVSLSRGGMIGLLAGLMFVVIFGLRPSMMRQETSGSLRFPLFLSRAAATAVIIVTIGAGVLWVGADSVIRRVERTELTSEGRSQDPRRETFYQIRGWIWRDTLAMIRNNWAMGVGLGAYPTAYPIYSERDGTLSVSQAHNDYLQIMADCGVVGAVLALAFIVLVFRDLKRALRHHDQMMAAMALGCGAGVFAMLVHSLFDFNLQLPSNALLFLVLTAVISNISWSAAHGKVKKSTSDRVPRERGVRQELEVLS